MLHRPRTALPLRLYPEEAAALLRTSGLLDGTSNTTTTSSPTSYTNTDTTASANTSGGNGGGSGSGGPLFGLWSRRQPLAGAGGEGPAGQPGSVGSVGSAGSTERGPRLLGRLLPSAAELQRSLLPSSPSPWPPTAVGGAAGAPAAAAAEAKGRGERGGSSMGAAAGTGAGGGGGGGGGGPYGSRGQQRRRTWEVAADMRDPVFRGLSWQLDSWYDEYWERLEPLRNGRRAQVWALRGAAMPYDWSLRREGVRGGEGSGGLGAGLVRRALGLCGGVVGALGTAAGLLPHRANVWEVVALDAEAGEGEHGAGGRGGGAVGVRGGRGRGAGGLAAAQAAARRPEAFALRNAVLVPPQWL